MLNRIPLESCLPNKSYIIDEIIRAIWDHPCAAYESLRKKVEPRAKEMHKWEITFPGDSLTTESIDTLKRTIRW
jgi:hypothetical protein